MTERVTVVKTLKALQQRARDRGPPDHSTGYRMGAIPEDLASADARTLTVDGETSAALSAAVETIAADERFEYMNEKDIDAALWRFVCKAAIERAPNHVLELPRLIGQGIAFGASGCCC